MVLGMTGHVYGIKNLAGFQATRTRHITQMFPFLLALVPYYERRLAAIIMHSQQTPR